MSEAITEGTACRANIGPKERRKRMTFGVVAFVASLLVLAALVATGQSRWLRVLLVLPFTMAGLGYFQARDKT